MDNVTSGCRALVPIDAVPSDILGTPRLNAAYLAQLLAIKFDNPQMRQLRWVTPRDAAAAYERLALSDAKRCPRRLLRDL
jgi:hypothetical protein